MTEDGVPANVLREISLLRHLGKYNHPNIVRLLDICPGPKYEKVMELYLIFEHVDQESMNKMSVSLMITESFSMDYYNCLDTKIVRFEDLL